MLRTIGSGSVNAERKGAGAVICCDPATYEEGIRTVEHAGNLDEALRNR